MVKVLAKYCDVVHCCDMAGSSRVVYLRRGAMLVRARSGAPRCHNTTGFFYSTGNVEKLRSGSIYSTFTVNAIKFVSSSGNLRGT